MPKTILVVDDEPDAVDFVTEILEGEGYKVVSASDGNSGLAAMKQEKPDLVVLDVQMPGLDGFQVFEAMKKDDNLKSIPVIMLTGIKEKIGLGFSGEEMRAYMGERPNAYIEKPIDAAKLRQAVKEVLG